MKRRPSAKGSDDVIALIPAMLRRSATERNCVMPSTIFSQPRSGRLDLAGSGLSAMECAGTRNGHSLPAVPLAAFDSIADLQQPSGFVAVHDFYLTTSAVRISPSSTMEWLR